MGAKRQEEMRIRKRICDAFAKEGISIGLHDLEPVEGGILNYLYRVNAKERYICKYATRKPRILKGYGTIDPARMEREYQGMRLFRTFGVGTPEVVFFSKGSNLVVMGFVEGRSLDNDLFRGIVDAGIAREMGGIIAGVHHATEGNPFLRITLSENSLIETLRIRGLYQGITRDRELQKKAEDMAAELRDHRQALVHGDFKPNNIMIGEDGSITVIDFEMCHFGNPVLDGAFPIHIYLHYAALHHDAWEPYLEAIEGYWSAYKKRCGFRRKQRLEEDALRHAGAHVLARLDGGPKMLCSQNDTVRRILRPLARDMICGRIATVGELKGAFSRAVSRAKAGTIATG